MEYLLQIRNAAVFHNVCPQLLFILGTVERNDEDLGLITLELWPECTWHKEKLKRFILLILKIHYFNWRLITVQYFSSFCHTLTRISHECTCVPHPESPSHLPPHPIPQGHPSAPALSTLSYASNLDRQSVSHKPQRFLQSNIYVYNYRITLPIGDFEKSTLVRPFRLTA